MLPTTVGFCALLACLLVLLQGVAAAEGSGAGGAALQPDVAAPPLLLRRELPEFDGGPGVPLEQAELLEESDGESRRPTDREIAIREHERAERERKLREAEEDAATNAGLTTDAGKGSNRRRGSYQGWTCHQFRTGEDVNWCKEVARKDLGHNGFEYMAFDIAKDGMCPPCQCCKRPKPKTKVTKAVAGAKAQESEIDKLKDKAVKKWKETPEKEKKAGIAVGVAVLLLVLLLCCCCCCGAGTVIIHQMHAAPERKRGWFGGGGDPAEGVQPPAPPPPATLPPLASPPPDEPGDAAPPRRASRGSRTSRAYR